MTLYLEFNVGLNQMVQKYSKLLEKHKFPYVYTCV